MVTFKAAIRYTKNVYLIAAFCNGILLYNFELLKTLWKTLLRMWKSDIFDINNC